MTERIVNDNGYSVTVALEQTPRGAILIEEISKLYATRPKLYHTCIWEITHHVLERDAIKEIEIYAKNPLIQSWDAEDEEDLNTLCIKFPKFSREEILSVYWIVVTNNLSIPTGGHAMFDRVSFIDHSCKPNSTVIMRNDSPPTVCIVSLGVKKGEEICYNYLGAYTDLLSESTRNEMLERLFNFRCQKVCCVNK